MSQPETYHEAFENLEMAVWDLRMSVWQEISPFVLWILHVTNRRLK